MKDMSTTLHAYGEQFMSTQSKQKSQKFEVVRFGVSSRSKTVLGRLVKQGIKTGTSSLAWEYEVKPPTLPKKGNYGIVVDGKNNPLCIIKTTHVTITPFNRVSKRHAFLEGEGNRSLEYWRHVHWKFFQNRCKKIKKTPSATMPIVCEQFKVVFPVKE